MQGKQAYRKACEQHLDIKMTGKKSRCVKRYKNVKGPSSSMLKTQLRVAKELQQAGHVREQIKTSPMYKPRVENEATEPDCNNNENVTKYTVQVMVNAFYVNKILYKDGHET